MLPPALAIGTQFVDLSGKLGFYAHLVKFLQKKKSCFISLKASGVCCASLCVIMGRVDCTEEQHNAFFVCTALGVCVCGQ